MEKLNILLCCGAGMSSGFLAAKSQNNIADDLPKMDILLIGPHLSYAFDELKAMCDPYAVPVLMIPKDMYAGLDGKGLLALCMETLKEKG